MRTRLRALGVPSVAARTFHAAADFPHFSPQKQASSEKPSTAPMSAPPRAIRSYEMLQAKSNGPKS
jgi:hypothetical protein